MSFVGEATGVIGLLEKAWNLLHDRLDPARAQAKRLIETFEAYGIARQQILRLLPELKLPNAAFSTPDKLKDNITPEFLDWAAEHLAISRSWQSPVFGIGLQSQPLLKSGGTSRPIGIGGLHGGGTPATPPGVRVRTGRFESLRS